MRKRLLLLVPFFILVYFIIHNTLDFYYFTDTITVLKTFLLFFAVISLLYIIGLKIFKNKEKFVLQFSCILFIFLFFGAITDTADKYIHFNKAAGYNTKLLLLFFTGCVTIILLTAWLKTTTIMRLLQFWMIYCLVICVYDVAQFFLVQKNEKKYLTSANALTINPTANSPSVFYFVFDMYPSDTVLNKHLGFNNSELNTFLKQKDFFVTGNCNTSYDTTYYSLCSTLNLDTLDFYRDTKLEDYKKKLIALKRTEQTTLLNTFVKAGYTFRNFSVFDLQDQPSSLEFNLPYQIGNVITSTTFLNRINRNLEPAILLARKNIDITFLKEPRSNLIKRDIIQLDKDFNRTIDSFSIDKKPSFNYFHFMIPHPPAVYDSSGKENDLKDMYGSNDFERSIKFYAGYIKYGNTKMMKMVNRIFEKVGANVIIIIQGDHGYREFAGKFPKNVSFGIMNAIYLPNKNYSNFNDTINPVNTFKQMLNNQFGMSFK